ncbi:hypothetical protein KG090_02885 [Carnobacteriaceae bacterium zg-ZUI240]|nr:hypothetical protein [Carnobacteriaceae bacterium zg-ZUI240]
MKTLKIDLFETTGENETPLMCGIDGCAINTDEQSENIDVYDDKRD